MITTTHAAWSYMLFYRFVKNRAEIAAVVLAAIVPDLEILFWFSLYGLKESTGYDLFGVNYNDLMFGSGISYTYWPLTLFTNSLLTTTLLWFVMVFFYGKKMKIVTLAWLSVIFHILLDCVTHADGNMIFWPLDYRKYLGFFQFNGLPVYLIVMEQVVTFIILLLFLKYKSFITSRREELS